MIYELLKKRDEALKLLQNGRNEIGIVKIRNNETKQHFLKKCELCFELDRKGKAFITDVKLKQKLNLRTIDIFVLDDLEAIQIFEGKKNLLMELTLKGIGLNFRGVQE